MPHRRSTSRSDSTRTVSRRGLRRKRFRGQLGNQRPAPRDRLHRRGHPRVWIPARGCRFIVGSSEKPHGPLWAQQVAQLVEKARQQDIPDVVIGNCRVIAVGDAWQHEGDVTALQLLVQRGLRIRCCYTCISRGGNCMIAVRLPPEIEKRLKRLARKTGRSKTFYVREAVLRHLEDLED